MCRLVITEAANLIGSRLGVTAEIRSQGDPATGECTVEPVAPAAWLRIAELVARYLPIGTVGASVVAAAEHLDISTLDRRDFSVVRPAHTVAFELLP